MPASTVNPTQSLLWLARWLLSITLSPANSFSANSFQLSSFMSDHPTGFCRVAIHGGYDDQIHVARFAWHLYQSLCNLKSIYPRQALTDLFVGNSDLSIGVFIKLSFL